MTYMTFMTTYMGGGHRLMAIHEKNTHSHMHTTDTRTLIKMLCNSRAAENRQQLLNTRCVKSQYYPSVTQRTRLRQNRFKNMRIYPNKS